MDSKNLEIKMEKHGQGLIQKHKDILEDIHTLKIMGFPIVNEGRQFSIVSK